MICLNKAPKNSTILGIIIIIGSLFFFVSYESNSRVSFNNQLSKNKNIKDEFFSLQSSGESTLRADQNSHESKQADIQQKTKTDLCVEKIDIQLNKRYINFENLNQYKKFLRDKEAKSFAILKQLDGGLYSDSSLKISNFYLALQFANLLEGSAQKTEIDTKKSLDIFEKLISAEQENAALYLFKAAVYFEMGDFESVRNELLAGLVRSTYYDDYQTGWLNQLYADSSSNLAEYFWYLKIWVNFPIPAYSKIYSMQKKMNMDFYKFGELMTRDGLDADGDFPDLGWSPIVYVFGYKFLNPNTDVIRKNIPTYKDLNRKYNKKYPTYQEFEKIMEQGDDCKFEDLENWFNDFKLNYENSKK